MFKVFLTAFIIARFLGFRVGFVLPSIAEVQEFEVSTRKSDELLGRLLEFSSSVHSVVSLDYEQLGHVFLS